MPTIKDVAKRAGVAPSTVSHFLTGRAPVSETTAARIKAAIDELGYRPNLTARNLRLSRTHTIGLVVANIANPFFAEIVRAIGHACQRLGYSLLLSDSDEDGEREAGLLQNLLQQRIDGLLVIHTGRRNDYARLTAGAPLPVVFVDREVAGRSFVVTDNHLGGVLAARHLWGLGHRRIGVLAGDPHVENVAQRLAGFKEELAAHGVPLGDRDLIAGSQTLATGRDVEFLLRRPDPPTAIFATNDIIALGAWRRLLELGRRVPEDISLVGYDNIEMTQWTLPPLTTVGQDKEELGRRAVRALIDAQAGADREPETILVPPQLIVRRSTAPI